MKKSDPNDEVSISMRLPRWLRDRFQVYADTRQRTLSSEVRMMMIEALEEWEKKGGAQTDAFGSTKKAQSRRTTK